MGIVTLRLGSEGFVTTIDGERQAFDPRLFVPIQIGSRIAAEQYGTPVRGAANGGTIDFTLGSGRLGADPDIWPWLAHHWKGRTFRVYLGDPGDAYEDLELAYTGRVDNLTHDTLRASIGTTDARSDLDVPIVDDLYADSAPEALRGRPKPELRGQRNCIAPVLIDEAALIYQVSRLPLDDITELRVGGIPWDRVASSPGPAQWAPNLAAGTFQLGGSTEGGEVRVDAKATGWASLTTAELVRQIVTEAGGTVNAAAMAGLDAAAPYLIGWDTTTEPVNRLNALDEIMAGIVGFWTPRTDGSITAGVLAAPSSGATLALSRVGIQRLQLAGLVPPAWRIRIEHSRNAQPGTQFFDAVSEADQQKWRSGGIIAPAFEDETIKTAEPRAVDVPLIRSLVNTEADAVAIRDRASVAWGVERRLYDVSAYVPAPELYVTASVDFQMVAGNFRVHSTLRSLGGGATALQLWG